MARGGREAGSTIGKELLEQRRRLQLGRRHAQVDAHGRRVLVRGQCANGLRHDAAYIGKSQALPDSAKSEANDAAQACRVGGERTLPHQLLGRNLAKQGCGGRPRLPLQKVHGFAQSSKEKESPAPTGDVQQRRVPISLTDVRCVHRFLALCALCLCPCSLRLRGRSP